MRTIKVKELLQYSVTDPAMVLVNTPLRQVAEKMIEDQRTREVYVVDDRNHFFGVITLRRLARCIFSSELPEKLSPTAFLELISAQTAGDLALRKPAYVAADDPFENLLKVMFRYDLNEIPVVDNQKTIVGNINMLEILSSWLKGDLDKLPDRVGPGAE